MKIIKSGQNQGRSKPWISEESIELSKKKREARIANNRVEYVRLRAEIQRKIRADKRAWLEEQCGLIDEFDKKHKSKELFRQIRVVKNKKSTSSQLPIKNKNQETLTEKVEIMNRWKEYGQGLFCLPNGETQPPPHPYPDIPNEPRDFLVKLKLP